jgi:hypothetical protein
MAHKYKAPKQKMTDKRRTSLTGQRDSAYKIMQTEIGRGKHDSDTYKSARMVWESVKRQLDEVPEKKPKKAQKVFSPGRDRPKKRDVLADRRKPFEKVTGTAAIKGALEGVARRALRGDEG